MVKLYSLHVGNLKLSLVLEHNDLTSLFVDTYEVKIHRSVTPYIHGVIRYQSVYSLITRPTPRLLSFVLCLEWTNGTYNTIHSRHL